MPWIVLAAAALPAVFALLLAVVGGSLVALAFDGPFRGAGFPAILGLLGGHTVRIGMGADLVGGSGAVGLRFLPLGFVTLTALVLTRLEFTRVWLQLRSPWPPLAGVAATAAIGLIALIGGSFTSVDVGLANAGLQVRFSLLGLVLIGAGPWLLGQLAVRWAIVRNLLWGLVALQLASTVLLTVGFAIDGDLALTGGEGAAAVALVFFGGLAWSLNALVMLLWWPFVGAIGMSGSIAALMGMAGEPTSFGFLEAAEQEGWLWIAPAVAIVGILAAVWLQPTRTSWVEVRLDVLRFAAAISVIVLPTLWAGRVLVRGRGELALDALADIPIFWDLPTGDGELRLDAAFGATGLPFRFLLALAIWCGLATIVAIVAAQRAGAQWASAEALSADARKAGGSLADRARAAAETARRAAEAAQQAAQQHTDAAPGTAPQAAAPPTATPPAATPPAAPPVAASPVGASPDPGTASGGSADEPPPTPTADDAPRPSPHASNDATAAVQSPNGPPPEAPRAAPPPVPEPADDSDVPTPAWMSAPPPTPDSRRPE